MTNEHVEVHVTPLSTRFDPMNERWHLQRDDLWRDLVAEVPGARRVEVPEAGTKGAAESVILALGTAGGISAMVSCFRLWLERDRSRQLRVAWTRDGVEESFVVTGDGMSAATLETLAEAVARRIES